MPLTILVTGGAGYVGSHTVLELLNVGHNVVCVDNLCNAFNEKGAALPEALRRVQIITGKNIVFYPIDIRDAAALTDVFKKVRLFLVSIIIIIIIGLIELERFDFEKQIDVRLPPVQC